MKRLMDNEIFLNPYNDSPKGTHPSGCLDLGYDNRNLNRSTFLHLGQKSIIYFPLLTAKSITFI